jgi:hypothetical protein
MNKLNTVSMDSNLDRRDVLIRAYRWCSPPRIGARALKRNPECSVIVANEVFWCAVPRKRFSDLARQPLGGRVAGHRKPQQLSPLVPKNKKCEQLLKRNRRNHEEIDGGNSFHLIVKEGLPGLQGPAPPGPHIN